MAEKSDQEVWVGQPSHIIHFNLYALCLFFCWLIVPVGIAVWRYWETINTVYVVTSERLFVRQGIFTKHEEEVELYRVKDYSVQQPFFLRLFDLYNLKLNTSDSRLAIVNFAGIPEAYKVRDIIRMRVESLRTEKNIREVDFNN